MNDYDVIVRIPVQARDMEEANIQAQEVAAELTMDYEEEVSIDKIECTGPAEET